MLTLLFCHQDLKLRGNFVTIFTYKRSFEQEMFEYLLKIGKFLRYFISRSEWKNSNRKTGKVEISRKLLNNLISKSSGIFVGFPINLLKV